MVGKDSLKKSLHARDSSVDTQSIQSELVAGVTPVVSRQMAERQGARVLKWYIYQGLLER